MPKTIFNLRIDGTLLAEAQRLVDAGEFDNVAQMIEDALRDFLKSFDVLEDNDLDAAGLYHGADSQARNGHTGEKLRRTAAQSDGSLESYMLRSLLDTFDAQQLQAYDALVEAFYSLVQHPLQDAEMFALAEISNTFALKEALAVLHEAQHSKLPLSPDYLNLLLGERQGTTEGRASGDGSRPRSVGTLARSDGPAHVFADFDNPLAAEVAALYQKEIGELTEKVRDQIATYIVEFPDLQRWHEAFEAAAGMNKRSLRYVLGVLRGNGLKIVEQKSRENRGLSKSERHREAKRSRNKDYKDYWDARLKARQDAKPE